VWATHASGPNPQNQKVSLTGRNFLMRLSVHPLPQTVSMTHSVNDCRMPDDRKMAGTDPSRTQPTCRLTQLLVIEPEIWQMMGRFTQIISVFAY
jgi:hypothetical protein